MDCLIDGIKLVRCDAGGATELSRDWNSHELDEFNRVPAGRGPLTFALHIIGGDGRQDSTRTHEPCVPTRGWCGE